MPQLLALLLLGAGSPTALALAGVASWGWIGLGAAAWAGAVIIKAIPGAAIWFLAERSTASLRLKSGIWGIWSALCELGATALVLLHADPFPGLGDAAGFGVAAGSTEVLAILGAALTAQQADRKEMGVTRLDGPPGRGAAKPVRFEGFLAWSGIVDRFLASAGHLATRGLIWTGLQSWLLAPGIALALTTFALVDGVATYGRTAGWNWEGSRVVKRYSLFSAGIAAIEVTAFIASVLLLRR